MSDADRKTFSIKQACEIEQRAYQQGTTDTYQKVLDMLKGIETLDIKEMAMLKRVKDGVFDLISQEIKKVNQ